MEAVIITFSLMRIFVCSLFVGVTSCVVLVLWYVLGVVEYTLKEVIDLTEHIVSG